MPQSVGQTFLAPELLPFRTLLERSAALTLLHDTNGLLLGVSQPLADLLDANEAALIGSLVENHLALDALRPGEGDGPEGGMSAPLQAQPADLIRADGARVPTIMSATL